MALSTIADMEAIGAVKAGTLEGDRLRVRADRLLSMVTDQVITFARIAEVDVAAWPAAERGALATLIAEIAARRLARPSATNTADGALDSTALLTEADERRLMHLPSLALARAGEGSHQIVRADSWHATVYPDAVGFFEASNW